MNIQLLKAALVILFLVSPSFGSDKPESDKLPSVERWYSHLLRVT